MLPFDSRDDDRVTITDVARFADGNAECAHQLDGARTARADADDLLNRRREDRGDTTYKRRREIEQELADYLDEHHLYPKLVNRMRSCRKCGTYGYRNGDLGQLIVMWDDKCSLTRLCPDEARTEQRRLVKRYYSGMTQWARAHRRRRIQSVVLTWPNVTPGDLAAYKRLMFRWFVRWMRGQGLPVGERACEAIKGALVSQEDPLSARGDWNIHLNAHLLIDGRFDWSAARAQWFAITRHLFPDYTGPDFQVHFRELPREGEALKKALRELIKYAAKHVTEKAHRRAAKPDGDIQDGENPATPTAPGLAEWPPERFIEWWEAGLRFRRTRAYGELYGLEDVEDEPIGDVVLVGRVEWSAKDRGYKVYAPAVNLIQGDKSAGANRETDNSHRATGPPNASASPSAASGDPSDHEPHNF